MNLRVWVRWLLFLSSYSPLFAVLLIRTWDDAHLRLVWGSLVVVPMAITLTVFARANRIEPDVLERVTVRDRAAEGAAYFATYVISFVPDSNPSTRDLASLGILLVVLGAIYVNSGLIHLNPTLSLLGWHVYDVRGVPAAGHQRISKVLISRQPIQPASEVRFVSLSSSVAVAKT